MPKGILRNYSQKSYQKCTYSIIYIQQQSVLVLVLLLVLVPVGRVRVRYQTYTTPPPPPSPCWVNSSKLDRSCSSTARSREGVCVCVGADGAGVGAILSTNFPKESFCCIIPRTCTVPSPDFGLGHPLLLFVVEDTLVLQQLYRKSSYYF